MTPNLPMGGPANRALASECGPSMPCNPAGSIMKYYYFHWAFLGQNVAFLMSHFDSSEKSLPLPLCEGVMTVTSGKSKSPQEAQEFLDLECISLRPEGTTSRGTWGGCCWGEKGHLYHAVNNNNR